MKKITVAGVVAASLVALSSGAIAGDKVEVEWSNDSKRFDVGQLKTVSVCTFKSMVASEFGLKMKKFHLMKNGRRLSEDKTLAGDNIFNNNKLQVKEVRYSNQC